MPLIRLMRSLPMYSIGAQEIPSKNPNPRGAHESVLYWRHVYELSLIVTSSEESPSCAVSCFGRSQVDGDPIAIEYHPVPQVSLGR